MHTHKKRRTWPYKIFQWYFILLLSSGSQPVVLEGVPGVTGPQLNDGELVAKWTIIEPKLWRVK